MLLLFDVLWYNASGMEVRENEVVMVQFDSGHDDVRPGIDPIEST